MLNQCFKGAIFSNTVDNAIKKWLAFIRGSNPIKSDNTKIDSLENILSSTAIEELNQQKLNGAYKTVCHYDKSRPLSKGGKKRLKRIIFAQEITNDTSFGVQRHEDNTQLIIFGNDPSMAYLKGFISIWQPKLLTWSDQAQQSFEELKPEQLKWLKTILPLWGYQLKRSIDSNLDMVDVFSKKEFFQQKLIEITNSVIKSCENFPWDFTDESHQTTN